MVTRTKHGYIRELVVNVVAEPGGVDDGESDANTILLEFCGDSAACRRLYVK